MKAGRDGWWLHRWLREQGIDNIVVDSSSIEVNRRAKRAKTDRLDADKLLALLLRYHRGERRVWSVVHEPTAQEEDARRTHREIARLVHERIAHTNRIGSLLVMHNLRPGRIGGRTWQGWWDAHCMQVPPLLRAEIEREYARLVLAKQQLNALETERRHEVAEGAHPVVAQLAKLRAIGPRGAWILDKELFGWRRFANRRELGRLSGPGAHTLRQRHLRGRTGHQQGGQQASTHAAGGVGVAMAKVPARQRLEPVVPASALASRANALGASASSRWRGAWPLHYGVTSSTVRSRPGQP